MSDFSWYAVPDADYIEPTGWATREEAEEHCEAIETANPCSCYARPASEVDV